MQKLWSDAAIDSNAIRMVVVKERPILITNMLEVVGALLETKRAIPSMPNMAENLFLYRASRVQLAKRDPTKSEGMFVSRGKVENARNSYHPKAPNHPGCPDRKTQVHSNDLKCWPQRFPHFKRSASAPWLDPHWISRKTSSTLPAPKSWHELARLTTAICFFTVTAPVALTLCKVHHQSTECRQTMAFQNETWCENTWLWKLLFKGLIWGNGLSQNFIKQNHHTNQGMTLVCILCYPKNAQPASPNQGNLSFQVCKQNASWHFVSGSAKLKKKKPRWRGPEHTIKCGWVALASELIEFMLPLLICAIKTSVWHVQPASSAQACTNEQYIIRT